LQVSERRACAALGQHRSTERKLPQGRADAERLTADVVELARQYGRYGYRKIAAFKRDGITLVTADAVSPECEPVSAAAGWECGKQRSNARRLAAGSRQKGAGCVSGSSAAERSLPLNARIRAKGRSHANVSGVLDWVVDLAGLEPIN